jgi:hypothetical protein
MLAPDPVSGKVAACAAAWREVREHARACARPRPRGSGVRRQAVRVAARRIGGAGEPG